MVYLQGKVYKGQHKRRKRVLKYLKSAIFFYSKLNEKNKVLLKKMVWKKVFAGGREWGEWVEWGVGGGVTFNWGVTTISKKGGLVRMGWRKIDRGCDSHRNYVLSRIYIPQEY